jgi:hypothetical protein
MKVGSPPFADLHFAACTTYDLRPANPPESKLDGGAGKEGAQSFSKVLEILDETPIASEPGEGRSTFGLGSKHRPGPVNQPSGPEVAAREYLLRGSCYLAPDQNADR